MGKPEAGDGQAGLWRLVPAVLAAAAFLWFAGFVGPVSRGATPEAVLPWAPSLGVEFSLRLDGLSLAFALLIAGIGAICLLYAAAYFRSDPRLTKLLVTLSLFAVSMLGLVLADDVVTLFLFWEGTTITSWILVGFDHERASARAAALQALLVTGLGGLALLAGLLLVGGEVGSLRLSGMNAAGDLLRAAPIYPWVLALVAVAAFTKSAQFPFQFWLPNAMAAPTPVSAYLHSATMVKAGVYLLARLSPAMGGTEAWFWTLAPVGGLTMALSAVWALRQPDLKMMLAFTTVTALGMMTMLIGVGTPEAVLAAMCFLIVHALYKAGLFLGVGMIEKGAGTRDYMALGGLRGALPLSFAAIALAALAMAGAPPFLGFVAKEAGYAAAGDLAVAVAALVLANALMVACGGLVAIRPFFGPVRSPKARPADPDWALWLGPCALAMLGLAFGLAPGATERALVGPMAAAVTGGPIHAHLALWHGFGAPLVLTLVTYALGVGLYLAADRLRGGLAAAEPRLPRTEGWYDAGLAGLTAFARAVTRRVQDGAMTSYLRRTFTAFALLVWGALLLGQAFRWPSLAAPPDLIDWTIVILIVLSAGLVLRTTSRLTAIAALGGIGAGIAIVFVLYGAIDVAMTQLFVEILVVIFIAIAMVRLPATGPMPFRPRDAAVAAALGIGIAAGTLAMLGTDLDRFMTTFFETASYPQAKGRNVVNVILVDFRGLDTMGEIAVIVIAGVAAVAALRAGRGALR
ncbi:hydrogen gas-evolving membrane-bound hydrogenase subunit E [Amaricoccus sp.]|uniref:hydrogen gas-evolving membrane-bound hydrogenase subunit E n=1 Tax=Amaricoccus sp. TaxID=1872485 RepID=UPI0025C0A25F|nr:hydrogen gas-evolving membrane-bound hydrogenase subunit E [Amaricoccus sp.]